MSPSPSDDNSADDNAADNNTVDDNAADKNTVDDNAADKNTAKETPADNTPTVSCSRCDRTWELDYELDSLYAGNQAFEQFALDHERHTGHFPDDVTPWAADCRQCPDGERFLDERPARRWAETHARHTRHSVKLTHGDETATIAPDENPAAEDDDQSA